MSKLFSKLSGFTSRNLAGVDKAGNRYFTLQENVDGIMKEKRWVKFKAEDDPTSIPVEWICWLNGQRKKAPTDQEMAELEARRERVKLNINNAWLIYSGSLSLTHINKVSHTKTFLYPFTTN
ncbi:hypothetical protein MKW94_023055, partial [Papaver nudicaule]|nr:hypothetical protein [Papaver nudicaule]